MARQSALVIVMIVVMIGLIVGLDVSLLRHHFGLRLAVNVTIVVVFGLIYLALRGRV